MVSLIVEALSWCSTLIMIGLETRIYIQQFRWYVRFGVIYVLVGEAAMLNLILSVSDDYDSRLVILPFPHQINSTKFYFLVFSLGL